VPKIFVNGSVDWRMVVVEGGKCHTHVKKRELSGRGKCPTLVHSGAQYPQSHLSRRESLDGSSDVNVMPELRKKVNFQTASESISSQKAEACVINVACPPEC